VRATKAAGPDCHGMARSPCIFGSLKGRLVGNRPRGDVVAFADIGVEQALDVGNGGAKQASLDGQGSNPFEYGPTAIIAPRTPYSSQDSKN